MKKQQYDIEDLPKIFDPLYTTKDPEKVTRPGLSVTYKIIREHHGEIAYKSMVQQGTTAKIKLPLTKIH
jgi:signal transduction histidine kinase